MEAFAPTSVKPPTTPRFAVRLAGSSGHELAVEGYWRPVINVAEACQRGWALSLRVRTPGGDGAPRAISLDSLNAVDRERVNVAAVRHGLDALPDGAGHTPAYVAILPVAWTCAKSDRARRELLRMAGRARAWRHVIPIAEIVGMDAGAPGAAIVEATASLKPIFGAVLAGLATVGDDVPRLMDKGFTGASLDAGGLEISPDRPILSGVVALLKAVGPTVMLQDINAVAALEAAHDAGVAWASLDLTRGGWHLLNVGLEALKVRAAERPGRG
ncbi:MAG TPA: hypothetical protein VF459_15520 [Caulobacteraceae bacterium]